MILSKLFLILVGSTLHLSPLLSLEEAQAQGNGQWSVQQADKGASHYSPLDQIDRDNIDNVGVAWYWESVDEELRNENARVGDIGRNPYKATPLMVDGVLYTITSLGQIAAIHPGTGETLWSYDPETWASGRPVNLGFIPRGITFWTDGEAKRIVVATTAAYLLSLDTETGRPDPAFGEGGRVDLTRGLGFDIGDRQEFLRTYGMNSPVTISRDVVVVGSSIQDTPRMRRVPPGHVRGYDVRTGAMRWIFHTIPQEGERGSETWEDGSWREAGATNVWPPMSTDEELGLVYLPVGTPSHNWYGGHRLGTNLYSSSLVAVEAETGRVRWHYQLIHHTLWDYDPVAAPILMDITVGGRQIKAVAQVTKQGFLFVFDRETGEPVWPIEERPVPQSNVPGERSSPTQPFPTKPLPFEPNGAFEDQLIDFTPELRAEALEIFRRYRGGPVYTPATVGAGTIVNPGWGGGGNWNGAAFDPETQMLYVPSYSAYTVVELVEPPDSLGSDFDYIWSGASQPTVDGLPIFKPPWGRITAIDMSTGDHVWQVANGHGPQNHPALEGLDVGDLGGRGMNFPVLTRTLLFSTVGGSQYSSPMLYAYDKVTGEMVWEHELPGGVSANPMTYVYQGKQYVAVSIGGGQDPQGLVSFALETRP